MAQIANTELSDTFDSWRNATNAVRHRINQFAVNESKLYANTIAANVELISNTTATFSGNTNISGMMTLKYGANFKQADANTTMTLRGTLAADGANTNITGGSLLVTSNANFTEGMQLQAGHIQLYTDSGSPAKMDFHCEVNNAHYVRLQAPAHADYSGSPTVILPTATGTIATLSDISNHANNALLINDRMQVANVIAGFLSKTETGAQSFIGAVTFSANTNFGGNSFVTFSANTSRPDGARSFYGAGNDLQIYHDGVNSYVDEQGTGSLNIRGSNLFLLDSNSEYKLGAIEDGAVTLYYDNSVAKLATADKGVIITGRSTYNSANGSIEVKTTSGTQTPDFETYTHFHWTLNNNLTLANPTTLVAGQSGTFIFTHSGGARTASLGTYYDAPNGTLALSTATGAVDVVPYLVISPTKVLLGTSTKGIS